MQIRVYKEHGGWVVDTGRNKIEFATKKEASRYATRLKRAYK